MSDDGADKGVSAGRALATVLGGAEQPTDRERATPEQMAARLDGALHYDRRALDYSTCAEVAGGMVLSYLRAHPDARSWPAEAPGGFFDKATGEQATPERMRGSFEGLEFRRTGPDLFAEVKAFTEGALDALDLTGFMWGWAVNAAKYALGLPPVANPAIVTVGGAR